MLLIALDTELLSKEIAVTACDVFQETLLRLATGEANCIKSLFVPVDENKSVIKFLGLSAENGEKFASYLKQQGIEVAVKENDLTKQLKHEMGLEYVFEMSNDDIETKLVPIFLAEIERLNQVSPEKLEVYKNASEADELIQMVKLDRLKKPVLEGARMLEEHCQDRYTKGALHVIFSGIEKIINAEKEGIDNKHFAMLFGMPQLAQKFGGGVGQYAPEINFAYKQFTQLRKESDELLNNEEAAKFKQDFKAYRNFEKNTKSNNDSLAALSSLFGSMNMNKALDNQARDQDNNQEDSLSFGLPLKM